MNFFRQAEIPPEEEIVEEEPRELREAKKSLLQNLLNGSLILATILFFINLYGALQTMDFFAAAIVMAAYASVFLITFVRTLPYHARVWILSSGFFVIGFVSLVQSGMNANGLLYFLISVMIIGVLETKRYWLFPVAVIAVSISVLGFLIQSGIINTGKFIVSNNSAMYWVAVSVNFLYIVFLISVTFTQFYQNLGKLITSTSEKSETLVAENQNLALKLAEFEKMSDRRKSRLVTTRQIARELSQQSDLDKLLHDSVELIRSQLGYFHAGIFLTDDRNENAILRAATGEAGRQLLEKKHRLRIRDEGLVGYVISRGEARTAFDVGDDSVKIISPALPNTRSEMAVPLRVGTRIFGALDVQSDQIEAFNEEDIDVLQSISDQLAVAIDKTAQLQTLKQKVNDLEDGYRSYTRGIWQAHLKGSKKQLNYVYKQDTLGTDYQKSDIVDDALLRGEPIIASPKPAGDTEELESEVAVPITLRNQSLGVLNIKFKGKTVPSDMVALVNNASDRLALALENARLLEQIQERAEREHLVSDISTKVRTAADIDTILRTTAAELGKSLGIDEVRIQLKPGE
jgi:GAF domain-containing protein